MNEKIKAIVLSATVFALVTGYQLIPALILSTTYFLGDLIYRLYQNRLKPLPTQKRIEEAKQEDIETKQMIIYEDDSDVPMDMQNMIMDTIQGAIINKAVENGYSEVVEVPPELKQ